MKNTKTASLDELKAMLERGEVKTPSDDTKSLDLPNGFWDDAEVQEPKAKQPVSLRVDPDILEFFKDQGSGHLTRMHAVLRSYVDAQQKRKRHTPS